MHKITCILLLFLIFQGEALEKITVAVKPAPPFVIIDKKTGELSGFSIDLVKMINKNIDPPLRIEYKIYPDLPTHLKAVQLGTADLGIAATTITAEREQVLDFSHPFYKAGLGIMVLVHSQGENTWDVIFSHQLAILLGALTLYILICGHLIWFAEGGSKDFDRRWLPGVIQGSWWTIVTMSTVGYGDYVPHRTFSKFLAVLIIFSGIMLFSIAVATFSSSLTIRELQSDIDHPQDLVGKLVAVIRGSIGEDIMHKMYAKVRQVDNLAQAVTALREQRVHAVVHDKPLLQYYVKKYGNGKLTLLHGRFKPASYGICFPLQSPLRKTVNIALLKLMEGDISPFQQLRNKWFQTNSNLLEFD